MRTPCPKCGAHGVWTRAAEVKRERAALVFRWQCTMCQHEWREEHVARPAKVETFEKPASKARKVRR